MMQKLKLDEGDNISLDTVKLEKGSFVKLKPEADNWKDTPSRELYVIFTLFFLTHFFFAFLLYYGLHFFLNTSLLHLF
jgi:hypothetical protein